MSETNWRKSLRGTISKGWPPAQTKERVSMTIRADDIYRQYAEDQDPKVLFDKAFRWLSSIQASAIEDDATCDIVEKEIVKMMTRAIFGSNLIERAGLGLDNTVQFCERVFQGEAVKNVFEPADDDRQQALRELYAKEPGLSKMPEQHVLHARSEVVQHARAYQHLLQAFVIEGQDMTEALLKDTHRILTEGIPIVMADQDDVDDVPAEKYSGIYRSVVVGAGSTCFTVPKFIPAHMQRMCDELKEELAQAAATGVIDPFATAAKYSMLFVQIHPFQDGNGRMCRLILNVILCRYAGIMVPIGEHGENDRAEYIGIKRRASENESGPGEYATLVLRLATTRLRELKKKLAGGK